MHNESNKLEFNDINLVEVALATYNGSKFINEMLDSISNQSYKKIRLIASDDLSSDSTKDILERYKVHPTCIINGPRDGIVENFQNALMHSNANYIALCDQDDVWHEKKIECLQERILEIEKIHGAKFPVLVFSDLEIVDSDLIEIRKSFYNSSVKNSGAKNLSDFIISNHIPGCCMMFNRALLDKALPFPRNIRMHDWWIALVASVTGRIEYLDIPLIKYRQHQNNSVGAPGPKKSILKSIINLKLYERILSIKERVIISRNNIMCISDRFSQELNEDNRILIESFIKKGNILKRLKIVMKSNNGEGVIKSMIIALSI